MTKPSLWTRGLNALGIATVRQTKRTYDGFKGAATSRLMSDWTTSVLHVDQQLRQDLRKLKARCRDLTRNSYLGKRFIMLAQANIVGSKGIQLNMNVIEDVIEKGKPVERPDVLANDKIELAWEAWAKQPTTDSTLTLQELQALVVSDWKTDGEALVRIVENFKNPFRFALQPIDTDLLDVSYNRMRTEAQNGRRAINEIRMGVEFDEWGRRVGYWLKKPSASYTYGIINLGEYAGERDFIPAKDVLHIFKRQQPGQTRGVPAMAPVLEPMRMLEGYQAAELIAARVGASKMGFFKTPSGSEYSGTPASATSDSVITEVEPGAFEELPQGWEFQGFDPQHPSTAYPAFVKAMLKAVASGLGVSYTGLASDLEGVNYSSIRAGVLEEREQWKMDQELIISQFMRPVFERWLEVQLLAQTIKLPASRFDKFNKPRFIPRRWPWVDPTKDVQAATMALDKGLDSRSNILAETGKDFYQILQDRERERQLMEAVGINFDAAPVKPSDPKPKGKPEEDDTDED